MNNNKSPHILNTSATLLGFCLVIVTSIKALKFDKQTLIDDVTGIASVLLMLSCVLSFLSMKTKNPKRAMRAEHFADLVFLAALGCLTIIITMVSFNIFK